MNKVEFIVYDHGDGQYMPMVKILDDSYDEDDGLWIDGTLLEDEKQAEKFASLLEQTYNLGRQHLKEEIQEL